MERKHFQESANTNESEINQKRIQIEEKEYECNCGKTFSRQHFFLKHLKSHSEETTNETKKCKFCPSIFETANEYLAHIEAVHQNCNKNVFMCSECGKQYKTKNELTHHITSKCGTIKQFKCRICEQNLMSAGSLYNHMLRHKGERSFMCRFCAKLFFTAGQLKVHERIHTQDKAYVCEVCNKGFCHRQSLITHSTLHTGIKPYLCENCGNSFSCVGNLIKHRKTHADTCGLIPLTTHRVKHPYTKLKVKINTPANSRLKTREKTIALQQEVEILKTKLSKKMTEGDLDVGGETNLQVSSPFPTDKEEESVLHSEKGNEQQKPKRKQQRNQTNPNYDKDIATFTKNSNYGKDGHGGCKYCGKKYSNIRWLYKHIKEHENSIPNGDTNLGIPSFKCSCCKMSFYTKKESLNHQQTVHVEILTCYDCDKIFANRDSLRSHQKIFHKGISRKSYSYICGKCGKIFKQKAFLKCHEEANCDKGPTYDCSICKKEFTSRHTRNNHMRIHDSEKKLLCKFCAKSFHWKGQLKIHERSHTGEKPFACLYCPKAFAYRESLMTHSTIHTGIKPHLCESCGSRFSCIGNLIKHRVSHASECGAWTYKNDKS